MNNVNLTKHETEVIDTVKQILEHWITNKEFIQAEHLLGFAKCLCIISFKGTGKSTSMLRFIGNHIEDNEFEAAWIRNSDIEFMKSNVRGSFTTMLTEKNLSTKFAVKADGVYALTNTLSKDKKDYGQLKVMFSTMNKAHNTASQNAMKHCKLIVYDEVINPEYRKATMDKDFNDMIRTLQRTNNAKVVLFGNAHESNNDILNALGIEFDWESGKTQVIYREKQGLLAIFLQRYEIKASNSADTATDNLFMFCESVQNFNAGKVANNNLFGVMNWITHGIEKQFKPLWKYDVCDNGMNICYCVGKLNNGDLYVKQLSFAEYENLDRFCYRPQDKKPFNTYLYETGNLDTVRIMLNYYNMGKLWFSSDYGYKTFTIMILPYLRILLNSEE